MGKKWFVIPALMVALVGLMGGAALAQVEDPDRDSPVKSLIARVAEKLGLSETAVQDAFDESRQEMQDEMIDRKLDRLVENGILTQEEADDYGNWLDARPDAGPALGAFGGFEGRRHGRMHGGRGGPRWGHGGPVPAPETEGTAA
jgi:hypothetical protein